MRLLIVTLTISLSLFIPSTRAADEATAWPDITQLNKPWTRWWWLGSAVDKENISDLLAQYRDAGMGGVEICPIYGVKGQESRNINYLSPKWMEMLDHTTAEGKRLDLGIDMTTGTGWPMGGPEIPSTSNSDNGTIQSYPVAAGNKLKADLSSGTLSLLEAISDTGQQLDLTAKVKNGKLDWTAPDGNWTVYSVSYTPTNFQVKRSAPGGEGNVIDPFSIKSLDLFLDVHTKAFASYHGILPINQFHDSYEYPGNFTPELFEHFKTLRGYDLATQLPALAGKGSDDTRARVLCDYRETMADLHTAVVQHWEQWCHDHGMNSREQAHGAPANLLDLYATADIPETECFGVINDPDVPMNKFSSSAAHVTGKNISSSESFTWLNDHFQASLAQVKQAADYLFLSGSNHIIFHGMPYSPKDATWPGWLFYAAVNFNPNGGLWHDLPAFNKYVAHCQSILQSGHPSDDVLLYFPVFDFWQSTGGAQGGRGGSVSLVGMVIGGQWLIGKPVYVTAMDLWTHGYGWDMISDKQIQNLNYANGTLTSGGNIYRAIVIPPTRVMPLETLQKLKSLAAAGAPVLVQQALPSTVPGLNDLAKRQAAFDDLRSGNAGLTVGNDLAKMLTDARVPAEMMAERGLRFIRRTHDQGYHYFIANRGDKVVDEWITLGTAAQSAVILDPMFDTRVGVAAVRQNAGKTQVYLQLDPGQSCILRSFTNQTVTGPAWQYSTTAGDATEITGTWNVKFLEGGPNLPAEYQTSKLESWTNQNDPEAKRFAGTASYTITFSRPDGDAADWLLDLGKVGESARIIVNGNNVGTLFSAPFKIHIGQFLKPGANTLEIDVTNLAINRIEDLDRRGVVWKIFNNVNVASHTYSGLFDASKLPLRDSGLMGPVELIPLKSPDMTSN